METFFNILIGIGGVLLFDVVFHAVHYVLYGETVGHCLKNDPKDKRCHKCLIDIAVSTTLILILGAAILGILFVFNI